ncbi:acidic leucine-rich nuclear phosphoprotein 32-related protein [Prunus yedoensis var. nudiflora]|uniref:Acidic leucine-rich nuclear phosphoprotein 32-related protein n=1 Tax=Prunus yedoensis var. nudiflora TaxID=2094558 RepID=A0A314YGF4_PRUYE|nr:acidic leucine-rich nuclear phosphoprotein 32-related protein [Prunus yedoensis var. nudiflora]
MDEIWERAVETALEGQSDHAAARAHTLDGAVKCHLSIANVGVSSLEQFPRLRNLQKLILSDNRIAGGLEFLVEAGLDSLRDLDLSNNRIQHVEDLAPLAQLKLVSLDLYECPVTHVKDYRSRDRPFRMTNGHTEAVEGVVDVDEDDESDADEEETVTATRVNGQNHQTANGFRVAAVAGWHFPAKEWLVAQGWRIVVL